ncbi:MULTISPECIES: COG1361 S-layer family protein [Haloferax]|uniref:Sialidase n=2 Tax=Haloferax TaxID=2251 RepID=A0A6G1Z486_9EURY|nr:MULTISPECIES: COG1361 S-layer family protein [Haloferax]KAB1188542.1 sialidase [Haloferax sp. CBA1149]MRW81238.1 sialidase [Haloferax marinisediminis]
MKSHLAILFAVLLILSSVPATVGAQEEREPNKPPVFRAFVVNPVVEPGVETMVRVGFTNDPGDPEDVAKTAENVRVELVPRNTPFVVRTGQVFVGTMNDSDTREVEFAVEAPENIAAGEYDLELRIRYEYDDAQRRTYERDVTLRVEERVRFAVVGSDSTVPVGGQGAVALTIQNVGELDARNTVVAVTSQSPEVTFEGTQTATQFTPNWPVGENRTFVYDTSLSANGSTRGYVLAVDIVYEDPNGARIQYSPLAAGFLPTEEQTFSLQNVESTLRVGGDGAIVGTVVNDGGTLAQNVVVELSLPEGSATATETEYAVGDLEPGASAPFSFDVQIADGADAGPRLYTATITYRDTEGERRTTDDLDLRVDVAASSPEFDVTVDEGTIVPGRSGELRLTIVNERDETLSDISAKIYLEDPLSSGDSEAFVDELAPGESATLVFDVAASGDALNKEYPVELDFRYEDESGDTTISDAYRVPVRVEAIENGGPLPFGLSFPIVGAAVLLVAVGGAGFLVVRRRGRR